MRVVVAGALIAISLVFAALGTYISLISGLTPWLACLALAFWVLLGILCLRLTFAENTWKRLLLPAIFMVITYLVYGYGVAELMRQHYQKAGFPRRYYLSSPPN